MVGSILPMHHVKAGDSSTTERKNTEKKIQKLKKVSENFLNSLNPLSAYVLLFRAAFYLLVVFHGLVAFYDVRSEQLDTEQSFSQEWDAQLYLLTKVQLSSSWILFQLIPTVITAQTLVHTCKVLMVVVVCFASIYCLAAPCFYTYMVFNSMISCMIEVRYVVFLFVCIVDIVWNIYNVKEVCTSCKCEYHNDVKELIFTFDGIQKKIGGRQDIDEKIIMQTFDNIKTPIFLFNKNGKKIVTFYGGKSKYLTTGEFILKTASQLSEEQKNKN